MTNFDPDDFTKVIVTYVDWRNNNTGKMPMYGIILKKTINGDTSEVVDGEMLYLKNNDDYKEFGALTDNIRHKINFHATNYYNQLYVKNNTFRMDKLKDALTSVDDLEIDNNTSRRTSTNRHSSRRTRTNRHIRVPDKQTRRKVEFLKKINEARTTIRPNSSLRRSRSRNYRLRRARSRKALRK